MRSKVIDLAKQFRARPDDQDLFNDLEKNCYLLARSSDSKDQEIAANKLIAAHSTRLRAEHLSDSALVRSRLQYLMQAKVFATQGLIRSAEIGPQCVFFQSVVTCLFSNADAGKLAIADHRDFLLAYTAFVKSNYQRLRDPDYEHLALFCLLLIKDGKLTLAQKKETITLMQGWTDLDIRSRTALQRIAEARFLVADAVLYAEDTQQVSERDAVVALAELRTVAQINCDLKLHQEEMHCVKAIAVWRYKEAYGLYRQFRQQQFSLGGQTWRRMEDSLDEALRYFSRANELLRLFSLKEKSLPHMYGNTLLLKSDLLNECKRFGDCFAPLNQAENFFKQEESISTCQRKLSRVFYKRGHAYNNLGNKEDALLCFQQAISLHEVHREGARVPSNVAECISLYSSYRTQSIRASESATSIAGAKRRREPSEAVPGIFTSSQAGAQASRSLGSDDDSSQRKKPRR